MKNCLVDADVAF